MFKSPNEEFHRILDVVSKYSVHNANVGFGLRKTGEGMSVRTPAKSTKIENIRIVYGAEVAKSLMPIDTTDNQLQFTMDALVTNVTYSSKKATFLLFINHRLVESTSNQMLARMISCEWKKIKDNHFLFAGIKNGIDHVFATFLPKGSHPFVYIGLELEPNNVDVNVHPTKHEVHFLHEDRIVEKIKQTFEEKLVGCNETRSLYTQQLLPGATEPLANTSLDNDADATKETRVYAKDMVRSDSKAQKLEKFFGQSFKASSSPKIASASSSQGEQSDEMPSSQPAATTSSSQTFPRCTSNENRK